MKKFSVVIMVVMFAAGCATAPSTEAPTARATGTALTYGVTAPATVTYAFVDSSTFHIQGGAIGDIRASVAGSGTADATFSPKPPDVELRLRITDFAGSFTNSAMGGTTNATEADITGDAVITLTPRGVVTVNQTPTATRAAQSVGIGATFFRRFTLRLPGGMTQRGATWVDTVTSNEENAGTKARVQDVVTATWARDTVLNGRTLNVITHSTQRMLEISGTNEGVEIAQKLTGTATGHTLWDAQRNLIVERVETTDLSGTFDLPAMGITGLPVKATGTGRITLR